jgi:gamma-glutamyl-gamma-aminobutyrate hydrolase PuuD
VYSSENILVNSYHGQTIHKLHSSATCLATDALGACEAWIDKNIAGVVWHPERMEIPFLPAEIRTLMKI